jgi:hypothetical protein
VLGALALRLAVVPDNDALERAATQSAGERLIARQLVSQPQRVNGDAGYRYEADAAIKNDQPPTPSDVSRLVFGQATEVELLAHISSTTAKFRRGASKGNAV